MEMGKEVKFNNETLLIRRYDPIKDEEKVLELWQAAFNASVSADIWRWKYIDNPYETAILICENSKGVPVVFYGGIPYTSTCDNKKCQIIHLSDIMSHPDYRGSGLFIHTANAYFDTFGNLDDILIMYGFPGKFHFDIGAKYLDYSPLGKGAAFLTAQVRKISTPQRPSSQGVGVEMLQLKKSESCFDAIWQQLASVYPQSVIRDRAYMTWRFFNHPQKQYEVWVLNGGQHLNHATHGHEGMGYVVLQHQPDGKRTVIVDMLLPSAEEIVRDGLGQLAEHLGKRGVQTLETWLPSSHFLVQIFENCCFNQKKEPTGIIPTVRLFDPALDLDQVCQSFYFTMGDGDLF